MKVKMRSERGEAVSGSTHLGMNNNAVARELLPRGLKKSGIALGRQERPVKARLPAEGFEEAESAIS